MKNTPFVLDRAVPHYLFEPDLYGQHRSPNLHAPECLMLGQLQHNDYPQMGDSDGSKRGEQLTGAVAGIDGRSFRGLTFGLTRIDTRTICKKIVENRRENTLRRIRWRETGGGSGRGPTLIPVSDPLPPHNDRTAGSDREPCPGSNRLPNGADSVHCPNPFPPAKEKKGVNGNAIS